MTVALVVVSILAGFLALVAVLLFFARDNWKDATQRLQREQSEQDTRTGSLVSMLAPPYLEGLGLTTLARNAAKEFVVAASCEGPAYVEWRAAWLNLVADPHLAEVADEALLAAHTTIEGEFARDGLKVNIASDGARVMEMPLLSYQRYNADGGYVDKGVQEGTRRQLATAISQPEVAFVYAWKQGGDTVNGSPDVIRKVFELGD